MKAYDSVEWVYIEQVIKMLGFPEIFVKWIMTYIGIVAYSVIINDKPAKPFDARKGLRLGDPLSPVLFVMAMKYLSRLLKPLKDNKKFKFHPKCTKVNLVQLGFADDLLLFTYNQSRYSINSFKYLGVLLSTKRLSTIQCEPLIDRMLSRIQCWTTNVLSYDGRAMLIKSVLVAIQTFWAQIFILQKKIIHFIEIIYKRFLWARAVEPTKKALISWDKLCATKGNTIWNTKPKSASWVIQKIFKAKNYFEVSGYTEEEVNLMERFSAIQDRLATKERLERWGIMEDKTCLLCQRENETLQHLFFDCEVSTTIWQQLINWQGIQRTKGDWQEELQWIEKVAKGKANVIVDTLSRKTESMGSLDFIPVRERPLAMDVQALANMLGRLDISELSRVLACFVLV
ncbi:uncharacterized protein LOC142168130 [Nicotiana tabacum]|uniref:Uncharacterized protein LOC142168130 n=1 Tax=Nicotiana tabacum TaxID=4097 RepID=A0AC58SIU0_TOBAC